MKVIGLRSRLLALLVVVAGYMHVTTVVSFAADDRPQFCDSVCGDVSVSCGQNCYPDQFAFDQDQPISCNTYTGGACGNTCETECDGDVSGSTSCDTWNATPTTCGSYGLYAGCGDGWCALDWGENSGNCGTDCPEPAAGLVDELNWTQGDVDDLMAMTDDIDNAGGFNESIDAAEIVTSYAYAYGYIPAEYAPEIDFDPDGLTLSDALAQQNVRPDGGEKCDDQSVSCTETKNKATKLNSLAAGMAAVGSLYVAGAWATGGTIAALSTIACPPCAIAFGAGAVISGVISGFSWLKADQQANKPCSGAR